MFIGSFPNEGVVWNTLLKTKQNTARNGGAGLGEGRSVVWLFI